MLKLSIKVLEKRVEVLRELDTQQFCVATMLWGVQMILLRDEQRHLEEWLVLWIEILPLLLNAPPAYVEAPVANQYPLRGWSILLRHPRLHWSIVYFVSAPLN